MTSPKIKTVHLITLLELGGAQGNTLYTVENLDQDKFETYLFSGRGAYWDKFAQEKFGPNGKIKFISQLVRPIRPFSDLLAFVELILAFRKLKPAVLHTHSSKAGILGRWAGWLAGIPHIIHTFHGFGFNNRQNILTQWIFITLEKWTAKISTRLVFVSESNRSEALDKGIGNSEQYLLIRSGIPLEKIKKQAQDTDSLKFRKSLNLSPDHKIITTIGAFKPQKNLQDFIDIAQIVASQIDKARFLIVGDGILRPKLEKQIEELHLTDKFKLLGWREDVPSLLAISDVFALTSLWEGLPRALVEAMTIGIPAVCYETDGIRDLLTEREGLLIKQGQKREMALKIIQFLRDNHSNRDIYKDSLSKIRDEFDINTMVHKQESLYLSLF